LKLKWLEDSSDLLEIETYVLRDSKTLCRELLELKLPPGEDIWIITGEVVAMYPNIPMDEGISRIAGILGTSAMEFTSLADAADLNINGRKELIILFLRLVLKFNYVGFGDKTFRQVVGTAMGTSRAPTYANLFLASFEGLALNELKDTILFYKRPPCP
jgi:hypothetical protein